MKGFTIGFESSGQCEDFVSLMVELGAVKAQEKPKCPAEMKFADEYIQKLLQDEAFMEFVEQLEQELK